MATATLDLGLKATWNYPTTVRFGVGRAAEIPEACSESGMQRPLLVTDPALAGLAMTQDVLAACRAAGLEAGLFSDVQGNPTGANVAAGVAAFRAGGHDGVLAFGGGSALDAGKAIAFMVGQERPIWDFEDVGDHYKRALTEGIAPVVAVPTTAGTGSEVGRAAVITDEESHRKKVIFHPRMLPRVAVLDPALTRGLPPKLTAGTGMDALAHCLEAYCAPGYHPLADGIALEGMHLVKDYLPRAFRDGADLEARAHMMAAAGMGAAAFQKGLGAIHALSHPVGAVYGTHHGLTNAVFMPYVLVFNQRAIEERVARAARYLALDGFEGFLDWTLALREQLGVPHTAAALGVTEDRVEELAEMAAADPTAGGNPVPVGAAELAGLYRQALSGRLA